VAFRTRQGGERRGTPADFLVVGLGNPGTDFEGTRHNVGADTVDLLARRHGQVLRKGKERAMVAEVHIAARRVALAFPLTYMNLSGESVQLLVRRYGLTDGEQLVIVHDELDLEAGRLKLKQGGGLAGHNGLRSIVQHLGTTDFVRLRIGVGRPPSSQSGKEYVLRRPGKAEQVKLDIALAEAADAVEHLVAHGVDSAMNVVNRRNQPTYPDPRRD
jgi:PTH1 family peptidyl-tRNA hydrolase